jgi:hypothetical protein
VKSGAFPREITLQVEVIAAGQRQPAGIFEIDHIVPV